MRNLKKICLVWILAFASFFACTSDPAVTEKKDWDDVSDAILRQKYRYEDCYHQETSTLKIKPRGKVIVTFYVEDSGDVSEAKIESTTLHSPAIEACVLRVLNSTGFNRHADPRISIRYPFNFTN